MWECGLIYSIFYFIKIIKTLVVPLTKVPPCLKVIINSPLI